MEQVVIGSRASRLALLQARYIIGELKRIAPHNEYVIKEIKTKGDKILDVALAKIGDKGLFVKEIENALINGEIDLAVHSMKDLPTAIPMGLTVGAVTAREDPRDVVLSLTGLKLAELPPGSLVGTSSLRRAAQLGHRYPHLKIESVRGNLDTRLRKLKGGNFSVLILAYAGVKRMGWLEHISEIIPEQTCLPAVGQGALGLEIREEDVKTAQLIRKLNHHQTEAAVIAERSFLRKLEGGCQVPIGALGEVIGEELTLHGIIASLSGDKLLQGKETGSLKKAQEVGECLAEDLIAKGGSDILEEVRREFNGSE